MYRDFFSPHIINCFDGKYKTRHFFIRIVEWISNSNLIYKRIRMYVGYEYKVDNMVLFLGPLGNLIPVLPNLARFKFYFVVIGIGNLYNFIRWKENIRVITIFKKYFR